MDHLAFVPITLLSGIFLCVDTNLLEYIAITMTKIASLSLIGLVSCAESCSLLLISQSAKLCKAPLETLWVLTDLQIIKRRTMLLPVKITSTIVGISNRISILHGF